MQVTCFQNNLPKLLTVKKQYQKNQVVTTTCRTLKTYMKTYTLSSEQFLPVSIDKAWDFFSSAKNLSRITPPEMQFKIINEFKDDAIYNDMVIDYIVRPILGIPLKWKTVITQVNKPYQFADMQKKGPYKKWEHTHTFITLWHFGKIRPFSFCKE